KEFILNIDHQALKYLNNSFKPNRMHARWISYIQKFTFSLKYKLGQLNKVANALSCRVMLLIAVQNKIIGFDYLKDLYVDDEDFKEEWEKCINGVANKHQIHDGFLFFENHLRIPEDLSENTSLKNYTQEG
ncbi:hypothetical protein PanWU01x14_121890, partial [Parasponia andersonii]